MEPKIILREHNDADFYHRANLKFEAETNNPILKRRQSEVSARIKETRPDIILLDFFMPHKNSYQTIKKIKQSDVFTKAPVLILASDQMNDSQKRRLKGGYAETFFNTIQQDELPAWLKHYLRDYSEFEKKIFYEELIRHQLKEILLNWKKPEHQPNFRTPNVFDDFYLDALFLFNYRVQNEYNHSDPWNKQKLYEDALVNTIEFCPNCFQYDVQINYTCPDCESMNLTVNLFTDIFNISFHCNDCDCEIDTPQVRCRCLNCNKKFPSEKVIEQKIYKYKISKDDLLIGISDNPPIATPGVANKKDDSPFITSKIKPVTTVNHKNQINYLAKAFIESHVDYISPSRFPELITNQINVARSKQDELTIMSVIISNLDKIILKLNSQIIINIFKVVIYAVAEYLRANDVLSFNGDQQKIQIMLPRTNLRLTKIICKRILDKLFRFQNKFQIEINLASFPQDGRTTEEILTMLDLGIEKIGCDFLA